MRNGLLAFMVAAMMLASLRGEPENRIVLAVDWTAEHPRNSEGAFAALQSGRIIFYYSQFLAGDEDYSPARIVGIHSDDQGRTWSEPRVVVADDARQNVTSPSLVRLASGRLALFYDRKNSAQDCHPVMRISADEGTTWSEATLVFDAPGYFVLNNDRVVVTGRGRLILPVAFHRSLSLVADGYGAVDLHGIVLWYYSDDEGATWRQSPTWWALPVASGNGLQEPGVVELADGSLFSWARTDRGAQFGFRSRDGGVSWSEPSETGLKSPCAPASIKRLPGSNALLAVYNDHSGRFPYVRGWNDYSGRTPLVVAISADGGTTWPWRKAIETDLDHNYCYTAIHFTGDAVLLAYGAFHARNAKGDQPDRLCIRRISLSWLPASIPLAAAGR